MNWNKRYAGDHWNKTNAPYGLHQCDNCGEMKPYVKRKLMMRHDGSKDPFDICTDCIKDEQ